MNDYILQILFQFTPFFIFLGCVFLVLWKLEERKARKYHEDLLQMSYNLNKIIAEAAYYQSLLDEKLGEGVEVA